jgi:hypothetical protein
MRRCSTGNPPIQKSPQYQSQLPLLSSPSVVECLFIIKEEKTSLSRRKNPMKQRALSLLMALCLLLGLIPAVTAPAAAA